MVRDPGAFGGFMCALATPVEASGGVDLQGLDRLLDRVVSGGASGVCPVGSTGEGPRLTREQRLEVVVHVRRRVPQGLPVIPAPAALNARDAAEEIRRFADAGADGCLLAPPAYFPMSEAEVVRYYLEVAAAVETPILLYNIPAVTKVRIPPAAAGELSRHPRIAGLKDSSRDLEYFQAVVYACAGSDFDVLTGSDTLLMASLLVGGSGAIAASANLVPELGSALYRAVRDGDWPRAGELQRQLFDVIQACRVGGLGLGWKAALELAGVCSAAPVPPAEPVGAEARAELKRTLGRLGVLEAS